MSSHSMAARFNDGESAAFSLSTYLTVENTHYRNQQAVGEVQLDGFEKFGRRVVGELGYAALLVVSLVETVARFVLGVIAALIGLIVNFASGGTTFLMIAIALGGGALVSLGNAACCTIALVRNIFERNLQYDSLCTPFTGCVGEVLSHRRS